VRYQLLAIAIAAVTLAQCASASRPVIAADQRPDATDAGVDHDAALAAELDTCRAELAAGAGAGSAVVAKVAPRVEVKVVHNGTPKKCAVEPPAIAPVATAECEPGMTCLDDKAQRQLAKNMAAYEHWVAKVQACEGL
jgi:hypothetical protein